MRSVPRASAERLVAAFNDSGYAASLLPAASGRQLCQHHCPVAHVARAHPDWILSPRTHRPQQERTQQVLDLSNPDAFAHELIHAWTRAQVELRHIGITSQQAAAFQQAGQRLRPLDRVRELRPLRQLDPMLMVGGPGPRQELGRAVGADEGGDVLALPVDQRHVVGHVGRYPAQHLGWRQYRALGATALDLCAVADGSVDATVDCAGDALGPWDYLGGVLLIGEAGGVVADLDGRPLVELGHDVRRTPVSAATSQLLDALMSARGSTG